MNEEQAQEIIELLETTHYSNIVAVMLCMFGLIAFVIWIVLEYKQMQKKKKMLQEYESTLNDEQAKALAKWKELNK